MPQRRILFLSALLLLPVLGIEGRLFVLQLVEGPSMQERMEERTLRLELIPTSRGRLLARDGSVLATDERSFDLVLTPNAFLYPPAALAEEAKAMRTRSANLLQWCRHYEEAPDVAAAVFEKKTGLGRGILRGVVMRLAARRTETIAALEAVLGTPPGEVDRAFERIYARCRRRAEGKPPAEAAKTLWNEGAAPQVLWRDVPIEVAREVELYEDRYPGFAVREGMKRAYPRGSLAGPLIGYVGRLSDAELESERARGRLAAEVQEILGDEEAPALISPDAFAEQRVGKSGLERAWESRLCGRRGAVLVERDRSGRGAQVVRRIGPRLGEDLTTTLDPGAQARAEAAFDRLGTKEGKAVRGAALLMDVTDGSVLVCVSWPAYDPNLFIPPTGGDAVRAVISDESAPMMNRAVAGRYPLGSVFKIVTGLAAFEGGAATPETPVECEGRLRAGGRDFKCMHVHGPLTFHDAMARSCNVYFYHLGLLAGGERVAEWGVRFGFGARTGIDCAGEIAGVMPTAEWKSQRGRAVRWSDAEEANISIGQPPVEVSPVQVLSCVATVATRGRRPRPRLCASSPAAFDPPVDLPPARWEMLHQALVDVVREPTGTAHKSDLAVFDVAGKTGTAQVSGGPDHAWFAGYGPTTAPRYAFVVLVEHGGLGGDLPPRIAARMIEGLILRR